MSIKRAIRGKHGALMERLVTISEHRYLSGKKSGKTLVSVGGFEFTEDDQRRARTRVIDILRREIARLEDDGAVAQPSTEPPPAEPPTRIKMGFLVKIEMYTKDAETAITSPEALRFQIGHMMDSWGIQEEVDYTLEVSRTYESS